MEKLIEVIVAESIAVILFGFAYAIGVRRKMMLIAGYNQRTAKYIKDPHGLARLVGRVCMLAGVATALMPLATHFWGGTAPGWYMVVGHYGGFLIGIIVFTILQSREYVVTKEKMRE